MTRLLRAGPLTSTVCRSRQACWVWSCRIETTVSGRPGASARRRSGRATAPRICTAVTSVSSRPVPPHRSRQRPRRTARLRAPPGYGRRVSSALPLPRASRGGSRSGLFSASLRAVALFAACLSGRPPTRRSGSRPARRAGRSGLPAFSARDAAVPAAALRLRHSSAACAPAPPSRRASATSSARPRIPALRSSPPPRASRDPSHPRSPRRTSCCHATASFFLFFCTRIICGGRLLSPLTLASLLAGARLAGRSGLRPATRRSPLRCSPITPARSNRSPGTGYAGLYLASRRNPLRCWPIAPPLTALSPVAVLARGHPP